MNLRPLVAVCLGDCEPRIAGYRVDEDGLCATCGGAVVLTCQGDAEAIVEALSEERSNGANDFATKITDTLVTAGMTPPKDIHGAVESALAMLHSVMEKAGLCTEPLHDHADGCPTCHNVVCPSCHCVYAKGDGPCPSCGAKEASP